SAGARIEQQANEVTTADSGAGPPSAREGAVGSRSTLQLERILRAVRDGEPRRALLLRGNLDEAQHQVAILVLPEHRRREAVPAAVPGAARRVEAQLHARSHTNGRY